MSIIVVYHKGCMDGFGAALVAGDGITVVDEGVAPLYIEGNRLFRTKKPIIAAVHGAAVGGGLGLAKHEQRAPTFIAADTNNHLAISRIRPRSAL
jgi:hypothetical protein